MRRERTLSKEPSGQQYLLVRSQSQIQIFQLSLHLCIPIIQHISVCGLPVVPLVPIPHKQLVVAINVHSVGLRPARRALQSVHQHGLAQECPVSQPELVVSMTEGARINGRALRWKPRLGIKLHA